MEFISTEGLTTYTDALKIQHERNIAGTPGWIFFTPPPTITFGRRGSSADLLTPESVLNEHGVTLLSVDRGGLTTFHGPGQIVAFPFGTLESHTHDPRGVRVFIEHIQSALVSLIYEINPAADIHTCREGHQTGIWIKSLGVFRKVASFGISFSKVGMRHGFAMNLYPSKEGTLWGFGTIVPCGDSEGIPGFLYNENPGDEEIKKLTDKIKVKLERKPLTYEKVA